MMKFLMKNNEMLDVLLADDQLFFTNFNQQYLLGNYVRRYFGEIYNNDPLARALKVTSAKPLTQGSA